MVITKLNEDEVLNQRISDEELQNIYGGRFDASNDCDNPSLTMCSMSYRAEPRIILPKDLIK